MLNLTQTQELRQDCVEALLFKDIRKYNRKFFKDQKKHLQRCPSNPREIPNSNIEFVKEFVGSLVVGSSRLLGASSGQQRFDADKIHARTAA